MRKIGIFFIFFSSIIVLNAKDKYLIITTKTYQQSEVLQDFVDYRSNQFDVDVVLNSDIGEQAEQYRNFINIANPNYVLLVGNYIDFPAKSIPYSKPVESYNYWVAEQIDSIFQIKIPLGLFFVENVEELENIVSKTIKFEQNIDIIPNKLYTHSGSTEALEPWPLEFNDEILTEMYDSFFKNNGYLHRHETSLDDTPNDAISDVQAINNGVKYILYHGHGNIQKWSFGMGVQGIQYLQNDEVFPIIFSSSCLTGTFTGEIDTMKAECFAVNMLSSKNGAAAFIGAFNESSRGQNPLLYAFSKNVNDEKYERLGDVLLAAYNSKELPETVIKYFPYILAPELNRARLQFHLFGDPALKINNNTSGIENLANDSGFLISPNPAEDYIEINLDRWTPLSKWSPSEIAIYNNLGQKVLAELIHPMTLSHRMNVANLQRGMYFIRIGDRVEKFVKC